MEWFYKLWMDLSWVDGFFFTLWIVGIYWGKKRLDYHFARKTQHAWDKSVYKVRLVEPVTVRKAKYNE